MKAREKPKLSAHEQGVLDGVTIRLIRPEEQAQYDALLVEQHYLHNAERVGEWLCYVVEGEGRWLALISWSAPAYRLKAREAWIHWTEAQRRRRLALVVNNSRFLILNDAHYPNLATRAMRLCQDRLSRDWEARWGHPVLVAESFVDRQQFRGTCYRAGNWLDLGLTQGYGRSRDDFYQKHDRPKALYVKELKAGARELLKARQLPAAYAMVEERCPPVCESPAEELAVMRAFFGQLSEWRSRVGDYNCAGLTALVVCASLCGVHRGQRDLAAFARTLSPAQLQALGFRKKGRPRRYHPPAETTFYRYLTGVKSDELEKALLTWQEARLGPREADDNAVAFDGKELRSSHGVKTVSAYAVKSGRWLGSQLVEASSNEIPAAQELLRKIDLKSTDILLADAAHTQRETAQIVVQEKGSEYLMTVKGNQPGLARILKGQSASRRAVSPSGPP